MADQLLVQIVVGTPEELARGRGETAVTITEAAARLRVSEKTMRNLVAAGRITPVATYMKAALFSARDVDALRKEREG